MAKYVPVVNLFSMPQCFHCMNMHEFVHSLSREHMAAPQLCYCEKFPGAYLLVPVCGHLPRRGIVVTQDGHVRFAS